MNNQPFRSSVIDYLATLSDGDKRKMMGATEVFCTWFDDLNVVELSAVMKNENFTEDEIDTIHSFHEAFERISGNLDVEREWHEIESDQDWIQLVDRAKHTLIALTQSTEPAVDSNG